MPATRHLPPSAEAGWLLLLHQIPPRPAYLRVKVGRHLQRIGAVAIKNSVYALPRTEEAQEDLRWVLREVAKGGGEASILEARFVDGLDDGKVIGLFQAAREADYREIARQARSAGARFPRRGPPPESRRAEAAGLLGRLRRRLGEVAAVDFFGAPGREIAEGLLATMEARMKPKPEAETPSPTHRVEEVQGRIWVTRAGIKVDRMASAWLIRRFIDPGATFKFVPAKGTLPGKGELRFDMFEAEFTHEGDLCTFEVLLRRFGLADPALRQLAEVVHDVDVKDGKYGREEAPGLAQLVAGIAAAHASDEDRLARGSALFDDLHAGYRAAPRRRDPA
ncbi:MAG TPA: chromate resistance protein ChrB domain-containing protein [Anaeromyxobacteraceae bacterium]|nr:chromate resistance protein ChrB domain-containing protein [Anaeromyxobacteraceae bacterium]